MDTILLVLRTGCRWNALAATGICSNSSAYRRFPEWSAWTGTGIPGTGGDEVLLGGGFLRIAKGGVKRSLLNDGAGIPLRVALDGANRHDRLPLAGDNRVWDVAVGALAKRAREAFCVW